MYRLLAIAKYDDRYVIPKAHTELAAHLMEQQGACGLDFDGGPGQLRRRVARRQPATRASCSHARQAGRHRRPLEPEAG